MSEQQWCAKMKWKMVGAKEEETGKDSTALAPTVDSALTQDPIHPPDHCPFLALLTKYSY